MYNKQGDKQEAQKKARAKRKSIVDLGAVDVKASVSAKALVDKKNEEASSTTQTPVRAKEEVRSDGTVLYGGSKTDTSLRGKIRNLVEDPYSSNAAFVLSYVTTGCILLSVLVLCMSTVEDPYYDITQIGFTWSTLDMVFNTMFTVELFLRTTCTIELKSTWVETVQSLDFFFWIDVVAVVPFWLTRLGKNSFINVLRAFSMSRMLKLLRQYSHLSVPLARAVIASRKALAAPFFFLFVLVLIFASFIYYLELEGENEGGVNSFDSIPHAIWFMMVTMTTVGYGDVYPGTTLGKCVCVFAMIMGVLFLSMPLAIVGSNFCGVWDERYKSIMVFKLQQALRERGLDRETLTTAFNEFDLDRNGTLRWVLSSLTVVSMQSLICTRRSRASIRVCLVCSFELSARCVCLVCSFELSARCVCLVCSFELSARCVCLVCSFELSDRCVCLVCSFELSARCVCL
ncbi:hypothetical protein CYMTET_16281, partial [Cymbomonas tetramitiformis]